MQLILVMPIYNERSTLRLVVERVSLSPNSAKATRDRPV